MPSAGDDRSAVGARRSLGPACHPHGEDALPGWYRTAGAASWRFLAIVAAVGAVAYALVYLRVVVLPIIVALLVSTLLLPIVRWLKGRGVPDSLAAAGAMLGACCSSSRRCPRWRPRSAVSSESSDPRRRGCAQSLRLLADPPFNLSEREIREKVDDGIATLRENGGPLARGVRSGAVILGEIAHRADHRAADVLLAQRRRGDVGLGPPPRATAAAPTRTRSAPASTPRSRATCAASRWSASSTRS